MTGGAHDTLERDLAEALTEALSWGGLVPNDVLPDLLPVVRRYGKDQVAAEREHKAAELDERAEELARTPGLPPWAGHETRMAARIVRGQP